MKQSQDNKEILKDSLDQEKVIINYKTLSMKIKLLMTAITISCLSINALAQTSVSGKIVSADTNEPVVGANIRIDRSLAGCVTNGKGEFSISNLPEGKHVLRISHVSYSPQSFTSKSNEKNILIRLEDSFTNIGQVVVTGTGTHHRMKDSPVPVTVITAKDLSNASVSSLDEALQKLTPSFSSMTNGMGTTLSLNGLPDSYFIFLENGKRLEGDDTYARINVAKIKRIEILNGASSALYGTNAIGGVVNIITDDAQNAVNISSNTRYASKGRFTQSVNADVNTGKFGSYTSYRRQQAESWQLSPYEESKGELVETEKIASTGFRSDNVSQRFTFDATDKLSFYARGGFYNNKTRRPYNVYTYNMLHETYSYGTGAKYMINKDAYVTADYYSDYFTSTYCFFKDDKKNEAVNGDEQVRKRTRYHNANIKGIFKLGDYHKLSVGTEYLVDVLKSETDNIKKEDAYTFALFAQDEIKIVRNLQALIGIRYIYHENFKNHATPNAALMYKLGDFNFRASYATGFRTPTLSEIYATDVAKTNDRLTIGNVNLKPEKSNYFALNAEYVHGRFSLSVNAFHNKIRDMIDYNTIAKGDVAMEEWGHKEVRQRDNIAKAYVQGINVAANADLGAGFKLNAGYTFLHTKDETSERPIDKSIKNAYSINALWGHAWKAYRLDVNLNGRINSKRYSKSYGYAPDYQLWDLNTRHSINLKSFILEPGCGIENIFNYTDDRPYNSNYATLSPGRSFYVSLSLKFKG